MQACVEASGKGGALSMSIAVSVSQARKQLSAMLRWTREQGDDVIIENRGRPEAVIIPVEDYELLQSARERKRRSDLMAELTALAEEVRSQNLDLAEEKADAIAEEISRDAIQSLADQGKIRLQD